MRKDEEGNRRETGRKGDRKAKKEREMERERERGSGDRAEDGHEKREPKGRAGKVRWKW